MASWFTRAIDFITPWDRKGEAQRRQEAQRKKRREEEAQAPRPMPTPRQPQDLQSVIDGPMRPRNDFSGLNAPKNTVTVPQFQEYDAQPVDNAVKQPKPKTQTQQLEDINNAYKKGEISAAARTAQAEKVLGTAKKGPDVAKDVIEFGRDVTGVNIVKSLAQGTLRGADETIRSSLELATRSKPGTFSQGGIFGESKKNTGIRKILLGSEPSMTFQEGNLRNIRSLRNRHDAFGDTAADVLDKAGVPGAFALGLMDALPGSKPVREIGEEGVEQATKLAVKTGALEKILNLFRKVPRETDEVIMGTRPRNPEIIDDILGEADIADITRPPRNIPVREEFDVPVRNVTPDDIPVNVRREVPDRPLIQDVSGGAPNVTRIPTPDEVANMRAREGFVDNLINRPDRVIDDVKPQVLSDYSRVSPIEIKTERAMLDDALANKEINKTQYKKANEALDEALPPDRPVEGGRKIEVKQQQSIPVQEQSIVPNDLPETPGKVRVTTQSAPTQAKTEAVATQPAPTPPQKTQLSAETEDILANPRKYNKRQVAAARNQRKLARQMAKAQEDTSAAYNRIDVAKSQRVDNADDGFAPTGEFKRGRRGNVRENVSIEAEKTLGRKEMTNRSTDDLLDELASKNSVSPGDQRRISAAKENLMKTDPENYRNNEVYKALDRIEKAGGSQAGAQLRLIPRIIRRTASADELAGRWDRKLSKALDNPAKITDDDYNKIFAAEDKFTVARDRAASLEEQWKRTGTEADFNKWQDAYQAAQKADTDAKYTEAMVAKKVLKGQKGPEATKVIDDLKKEADVNTMDHITSSMLSGTGTGFRNFFGTEVAGVENRLFANTRAKLTNKLFGENVGGFEREGAKLGRKIGIAKFGGDAKKRAEFGGKNPLEWAKNWATTINSAGESSLQSQVYSRLGKYYKNQFEAAGHTGKALDMRMRHAMLTDPDEMASVYMDSAMKSSGLSGLFESGQKIEKSVADWVGGKTDSRTAQAASKLLMRMAVGFPTATGNFLKESTKRLAVGLPSFIEMGTKLAKGDKKAAAMAFDRGLKEAGSGVAILGLGAGLGSQGLISGPYPEDKDERTRWEREGISENSIKIGDAWYPIPQGAGMLGLPLLAGAAFGRDGAQGFADMFTRKNIASLLPTDQLNSFLDIVSGDASDNAVKNFIASSARVATPAGALFNQIAKSFDPTKNDTMTKGFWNNVIDQYASGIPGLNNVMDIPDKTDDSGNIIKNPNPLELAFGASSANQDSGVARSQEIQGDINSQLGQIDKYGLLKDKNLEGVLDDSGLEAFNKAKSGQQLDESDIKALQNGLVKGVSKEGTDTAYLEREQYDTHLAVLKLKRDIMNADKTVKPSDLKDIDVAIKRGEVYKDNKVPYDLIKGYKDTSLTEWRNMGNPEHEDYDPDMYETLWQMDQLMTKNEVSDNRKGKLDEPKYALKKSGRGGRSGSGGRGRKSPMPSTSEFGGIGGYGPRVKAYENIEAQASPVPFIKRTRPNIVHKISVSG